MNNNEPCNKRKRKKRERERQRQRERGRRGRENIRERGKKKQRKRKKQVTCIKGISFFFDSRINSGKIYSGKKKKNIVIMNLRINLLK